MYPVFIWLVQRAKAKYNESKKPKPSTNDKSIEVEELKASDSNLTETMSLDNGVISLNKDLILNPEALRLLLEDTALQLNFPLKSAQMDLDQLLQKLGTNPYYDESFPSTDNSLTPHLMRFPRAMRIGWRRASDIYRTKAFCIFNKDIGPGDIKQGELGDCYFLSVLSVLAEKPHLIQRLFLTPTINKNGCYSVFLCESGEWINITVDDYLPTSVETGKPAFSHPKSKEIWVPIIEKAFAKLYGSYYSIVAGLEGDAFRTLTGAPMEYFYHDSHPKETRYEAVWSFITAGLQNRFLLTTSSRVESSNTKQSVFGVLSNHSYAILDAEELIIGIDEKQQEIKVRLVKIRNPWGRQDYKGAWSDVCRNWTPEIRKLLNYDPKPDDGIFWISIEDFSYHFVRVCCCKIREHYLYTNVKLSQSSESPISLVRLNVHSKTYVYLSVHQKSQRWFKFKEDFGYIGYVYSPNMFIICEDEKDKLTYKSHKFYEKQCSTIELMLDKGTYLMIVRFDWQQNFWKDFVLSCYAENSVTMSQISGDVTHLPPETVVDIHDMIETCSQKIIKKKK
jgi:calpain-15